MIMLSDLWKTEEDRITNTNMRNPSSCADRTHAFANDSNSSSESITSSSVRAIEGKGRAYEARRIRCKARMLSMTDHTADNAYFEIPLDAPHGMVVSCSHPKCAASGRRFRYCRGKQSCSYGRVSIVPISVPKPTAATTQQNIFLCGFGCIS